MAITRSAACSEPIAAARPDLNSLCFSCGRDSYRTGSLWLPVKRLAVSWKDATFCGFAMLYSVPSDTV